MNAVKRKLTSTFQSMGVAVKDFNFSDKCEIIAYKFFTDGEKPTLML